MAIKTEPSIKGFIASDPRLTFNDDGQTRFYARFGQNHYHRRLRVAADDLQRP